MGLINIFRWLKKMFEWLKTMLGQNSSSDSANEMSLENIVAQFLNPKSAEDLKELFDRYQEHLKGELKNELWLSAAGAGRQDILEVLFNKDANIINAVDIFSQTALYYAADAGHENVVEWLLSKGAKIEAVAFFGQTALHRAAYRGHGNVVELLLRKGANIEAVDQYGDTALHRAAYRGHEKVVNALLDKGAEINAVDEEGRTAFNLAQQEGHAKVIAAFEKYDLNKTKSIHAVHRIDSPTGTSLSSENAKTYQSPQGPHSSTEPSSTRGNGHSAGVQETENDVLKNQQTSVLSLLWRLLNSLIETIQNVYKSLVSIFDFSAYQKNPGSLQEEDLKNDLWFNAVLEDRTDLLESLLANGANIEAVNPMGDTALHLAAGLGHEKVVEWLLSKGAKIEAVNKKGQTALHLAAVLDHANVVDLLLRNGANIHAVDKKGQTALDLAAQADHEKVLEALVEAFKKYDSNTIQSTDGHSTNDSHRTAFSSGNSQAKRNITV